MLANILNEKKWFFFLKTQTVRSTQYIDYPIQNWQFSGKKFSKICIYKGYSEFEQKSQGSVGYIIEIAERERGWWEGWGSFPPSPNGSVAWVVGGIISTQIIDCDWWGGKW